jgi:tetrahydromethanopterin S-methyltransferase subunit E
MILSRFIAGLCFVLFGAWLFIFIGFIDGPTLDFFGIVIGLIIILIGILIFINKKEDEIEQIRNTYKSKKF